MPKHAFPLAGIFPHKDRIEDSVFIRENMDQGKHVTQQILCII